MQGISLTTVALFGAAVITQVISIVALPRTVGFTNVAYTAICLLAFDLSLWICAKLLQGGANLSALIPLMSAVVPLTSIAAGLVLYGEAASVMKIALLVAACGLVGIASALG